MSPIETNPASSAARASSYTVAPVVRDEHAEGQLARLIEQQTAKIPSHFFLFGALGSMGLSLALELAGRSRASRFVGLWPQTLLIAGIYNKIVKTVGTR